MQNVYFQTQEFNGNELTIREGKALELMPPNKIIISGDIKTVAAFIAKRNDKAQLETSGYQWINPDRAIVEVDKEHMQIVLMVDPEDKYGPVVTGSLSQAPELEQFCINKNRLFNREELIKLIRFNKIWFPDAEAHDKLLKAYQAFTATVNANIGKTSDTRGNVDNAYKKTVETNVPDSFVLNIPIFKGMDKRRFRVEIAIDSTDASTKFWFESVDLNDIIQIESEAILNKELESCSDYVIVWK
jgi:hypothetical protein